MLDLIGSVASIVAAVTSIALFIFFVWDRRHRLRVLCTPDLVEVTPFGQSEEKTLAVEVINLGSRPIVLDKVFLYGAGKLMLLKDSLRDRSEKVLGAENPSVTFYSNQEGLDVGKIEAIVVYDKRGTKYLRPVGSRRRRVNRWLRLRFTKEGRAERRTLKQIGLSDL